MNILTSMSNVYGKIARSMIQYASACITNSCRRGPFCPIIHTYSGFPWKWLYCASFERLRGFRVAVIWSATHEKWVEIGPWEPTPLDKTKLASAWDGFTWKCFAGQTSRLWLVVVIVFHVRGLSHSILSFYGDYGETKLAVRLVTEEQEKQEKPARIEGAYN